MNALQEATINMQRAVEQHLDANTTIIAAVPAFVTEFDKVKGFNVQISGEVGGQEAPRTGIAKDKRTTKKELCDTTLGIAKPTRAFATNIGDNTLRDEVNCSFTELNRLRDDQLAPRCQIIHDRANANRAALADYGITNEKLENLQNKINNYTAESPKPRTARANRSIKTGNLNDLFRQSKSALKQMDDLIDNFAAENPEFVNTYKNLRKIDKPPSRPRKPKGAEIKEDGENPT